MVAAIVLGSLAALPPLVGISLGLTGVALPTVPPLSYVGILAAAALIGWGAIAGPTRFAPPPGRRRGHARRRINHPHQTFEKGLSWQYRRKPRRTGESVA